MTSSRRHGERTRPPSDDPAASPPAARSPRSPTPRPAPCGRRSAPRTSWRACPGSGPVEVESVAHVNGWNVTPETMLEVARRASGGGVVVTHGTDTIEETAFFCDLTVESDVVFAGAMRNGSEISADGPRNLLCASQVAAEPRGLGTVLVLNDEIHAARWARKQDSSRVHALQSPGHGPVGIAVPGSVTITMPPPRRVLLPLPDALPAGADRADLHGPRGAPDRDGARRHRRGRARARGHRPRQRAGQRRARDPRGGRARPARGQRHARAERRRARDLRRPRRRGHPARAGGRPAPAT